jgi:predicted AAA+ superfamily ATPase
MIDRQLLLQVIEDQKSLKIPPDARLFSRTSMTEVQKNLSNPFVVVLSGIRRAGKSTLLQQIRQKASESDFFLNLDDERLSAFSIEHFQMLLEIWIERFGPQKTCYFDEIQNVEGWEKFIRRLCDQGYKVFLTGSNATLLSQELGTRLTGRFIQIEVMPYSFEEIIQNEAKDFLGRLSFTTEERALIKQKFFEFYQTGGLPEYRRYGSLEYLQTLYQSILYRDILTRYKLRDSEKSLRELGLYLASNLSKELSFSSLKNILGLGSPTTVKEYCHYLENSYLCFLINRFDYSLKKQTLFSKKEYFIDLALARAVSFRASEDHGRALENIVFLELRRRYGKEVYFHSQTKECDFIIREGIKITQAIQVCVNLNYPETKAREIAGLVEALSAYQLTQGLILTEDTYGQEVVENFKIEILPIWEWLLRTGTKKVE